MSVPNETNLLNIVFLDKMVISHIRLKIMQTFLENPDKTQLAPLYKIPPDRTKTRSFKKGGTKRS